MILKLIGGNKVFSNPWSHGTPSMISEGGALSAPPCHADWVSDAAFDRVKVLLGTFEYFWVVLSTIGYYFVLFGSFKYFG